MLIGEVSRQSGVSVRMLRHYDTLGVVTPTGRTSGGYREYSEGDIRRLFHVESLRTLGLSLDDARRALDEPDFVPAHLVGELIRHTRARITAEQDLLARLERVDAAAPAEWSDVLHLVALLRGLESEFGGHRQQAILSQASSLPVEALAGAALSEDDPYVAGALRWSLARAGGRGLAELAAGLESPSVEVRRRATSAIAPLRTAEATAALRRALDDPDETVRGRAALTLGARGAADAIPALLDMIVEGRNDIEAAEVLGLLTQTATSPASVVDALREHLDGGDPPTRLRITQALAEIPGAAPLEVLTRLTRDPDRTVAGTAAAILATQNRVISNSSSS